jgi:hypothetical protein
VKTSGDVGPTNGVLPNFSPSRSTSISSRERLRLPNFPFRGEGGKVCNRLNLAVAARSGEGPFSIRFADFRYRAVQSGGLLA